MLTAKAECMKRDTSGFDEECNSHRCGECNLCYEQGNMGEQIEYLQMAIKALEESQWILCCETDDLPGHEVLCCDLRDNMLIGYLYTDEGSDTGFGAESDGECLVDCVAWREKPEPWKGDEE